MKTFVEIEYVNFVKNKIQNIYKRKNSLTEQDIIGYCCQFTLTPKEYFNAANQSTLSEKLNKVFGSSLKNKPISVAINTYLLFEFGYIHCSICNIIQHKSNFYKHKNTWNKHKHYCFECQKTTRNNEHSRLYIKNNRHKYTAYLAKYRATKLKATPKWLTQAQLNDIEQIYKKAKENNLEVDHIIPLQNDSVCGLHVPWNLQLLTRSENAKKNNKYIEEVIQTSKEI